MVAMYMFYYSSSLRSSSIHGNISSINALSWSTPYSRIACITRSALACFPLIFLRVSLSMTLRSSADSCWVMYILQKINYKLNPIFLYTSVIFFCANSLTFLVFFSTKSIISWSDICAYFSWMGFVNAIIFSYR